MVLYVSKINDSMKKYIYFILGLAITSSTIAGFDVIQGLVLNDWSGIHPSNRFLQHSIAIMLGTTLGMFILLANRLFFGGIYCPVKYFKLGLVVGFIWFGRLVHPWINCQCVDWLIVLLIFLLSARILRNREKK